MSDENGLRIKRIFSYTCQKFIGKSSCNILLYVWSKPFYTKVLRQRCFFFNLMPLKVIVVGAGIAGLCAATALRQAGHDVEVCFEGYTDFSSSSFLLFFLPFIYLVWLIALSSSSSLFFYSLAVRGKRHRCSLLIDLACNPEL